MWTAPAQRAVLRETDPPPPPPGSQDWCNTQGMVPQQVRGAVQAGVGAPAWRGQARTHTHTASPLQAYGNMSAALNKTGYHVSFNMCEWGQQSPWIWGDAIAQSWRMAGDHTGEGGSGL